MNPIVQRYLPPLIVIGAAFYFGWPPSKPLDLGEDIVRATSVRWKPDALSDPAVPQITADPFREVMVDEPDPAAAQSDQPETPAGPDPGTIRAGLTLDGFADTSGRRWAIINGRPRLLGDMVSTTGAEVLVCEIISVQEDRVVVRCQETVTEIRPLPFGARATSNAKPNAKPEAGGSAAVETAPALEAIPPPPQL